MYSPIHKEKHRMIMISNGFSYSGLHQDEKYWEKKQQQKSGQEED